LLAGYLAEVDARLFPYFVDPDRVARSRYGVPALEVLSRNKGLQEQGFERLRLALRRARVPKPRERVEEEVLGFYAAALLAYHSGNRWAVSRLALAEAERSYAALLALPDEALAAVARLAGIGSMYFSPRAYSEPIAVSGLTPLYRVYGFVVRFTDYVTYARRLLGDDNWKPVNLPVRGGRVYLDKQRAARLAKEAIDVYVERRIIQLGSSLSELPAPLAELLDKVREAAAEATRARRHVAGLPRLPKGLVVEEAFPPCIRDIYERARRGEHLSHHERFAIATFLLNIGADVDTVVDVFRNMPDFKERITRYQVEHLAGLRGSGKKYSTYSCEKMKTLGLCRADCGTKNPVQAYYRNLRRRTDAQGGGSPGTKAAAKEQQPPRGKSM